MIARDPDEDGDGPYYRLLAEGTIHDYDGVQVPTAPYQAGIDLNRQFPYQWERKVEGPWDAGEYPGSEPEIGALLRAITDRKNICTYFAYHTFSGVHIRAYSDQADDALPADDLWTFQVLGDIATDLTGYPSISGYHDFRYHPKSVIRGVGTDWAYDHLGVYAWTTEFWNALKAAGLDDSHPLEWYRTHPLDEELQLLAWVDDNVPGGYVDWYEYDHPSSARSSSVAGTRARVPEPAAPPPRGRDRTAHPARAPTRPVDTAAPPSRHDRRVARRRQLASPCRRRERRLDEHLRDPAGDRRPVRPPDDRPAHAARRGVARHRHGPARPRTTRRTGPQTERSGPRSAAPPARRPTARRRMDRPGAGRHDVRRRDRARPRRCGARHRRAGMSRVSGWGR
ncbi:MAG: M14 family zinc carboxypeptidase [Ilumatobacteraceae bacterium]